MSTRAIRLACLGLLAVATPAWADVLILESTAPLLKAGASLPEAGAIEVPAGTKVTVMLPNGRTETITGPRTSAVKDLSQGAPVDRSLWDSVVRMLSGGSERSVGATRSMSGPVATEQVGFSWQRVPIDGDGNWCVRKGSGLMLERGNAGGEARVTVVEVASGAKAQVVFPAAQSTMPWPADVAPKVGGFALLQADRPMRQVTLRIVDPVPERASTLQVLHGQRCHRQMQSWLKELARQ